MADNAAQKILIKNTTRVAQVGKCGRKWVNVGVQISAEVSIRRGKCERSGLVQNCATQELI